MTNNYREITWRNLTQNKPLITWPNLD